MLLSPFQQGVMPRGCDEMLLVQLIHESALQATWA